MKKSDLIIRKATQKDSTLVAELGARTFRATYGELNTPEDMQNYLAANFSEEQIAREIDDSQSTFLLAFENNMPVGYVKIKAGQTPDCLQRKKSVELERIYIDTGIIGQGYGSALMQACLDEAEKNGHESVWLGVWERNTKAIAFYRKWGFRAVGLKNFVLGSDVQRDLVMERVLNDANK